MFDWVQQSNDWCSIGFDCRTVRLDRSYRPRLLGFHFLHVNAMKCIYVGFSLSKLQSFFWKISLNSCLIRLEGFNNKNSQNLRVCSTWPSGKAVARYTEGPEYGSAGQYLFLFASFLLFFFFFSFSFHFCYVSIYSSQFLVDKFSSPLYLPFPPSPSRGPTIYVCLVMLQFSTILSGRNMSIIPIVDENRSLSIKVGTN